MYDASTPTVVSTAPVPGAYNQPVVNYFGTIPARRRALNSFNIRISRASDGAGLVWRSKAMAPDAYRLPERDVHRRHLAGRL